MAAAFNTLAREALVLPVDQRIALAYYLLSSVDPDPEAEAQWEQEIAQRIARADAGETTTVSAAEVFARLQRIVPDQK